MGIEEAILDDVKQQGIEIGMRRGMKKGREEGKEKGREEGSLENQKKVIANGLKEGLPIELLATLTELTVPEVEAIVRTIS